MFHTGICHHHGPVFRQGDPLDLQRPAVQEDRVALATTSARDLIHRSARNVAVLVFRQPGEPSRLWLTYLAELETSAQALNREKVLVLRS